MGAAQEILPAGLVKNLRGPNAEGALESLLQRPKDVVKKVIHGLAALVPVSEVEKKSQAASPKITPDIVTRLKSLGADVIDASVCEQITGRPFNPKTPISKNDIKFVENLPEVLRKLVAIVPIPGDYSANKFGKLANVKAGRKHIRDVAYLNSYSKDIGSSREEDRWVLMLREVVPESSGIRDSAIKNIPYGFEPGNPAEQFIAIVQKRFLTNNQDTYFKGPWARGSSPGMVVGADCLDRACADKYPSYYIGGVGLGVSRISK